VKSLLIACDFDGTITTRDTLHVIVEAFGTRGVWAALEPRLRSGEMSVEQAMSEQFATVRATPQEVAALVRRDAPVREGFVEWVRWCRAEGHHLVVLSAGFRSVIEPVLAEAGVGDLEVVANDARFSRAGCELVWAERGERCGICDRMCKRWALNRRWTGQRLVYLGDGISDRCAARMADVVFARAGLAEHLAEEGVPFTPLHDFVQVRRDMEPLVRAAA
jgi:2-hydroxy-3-keto-5-methylthiopentenyl-1-phosphate phosphatase